MFGLWDTILNFIYSLFYYLGIFFMKILHYLYLMFEVFVGTKKVTYYNSDNYLINIFFSNSTITTIYGGMAIIGFVILIVMTIFAVYKKMHDLGDKMASLGEILRKALTSFFFIISMNFIMIATLNLTNTLMQSVTYLFDNAYSIGQVTSITFTDKQYAAMARVFNTIGNYSLSKSYSSRYNLNSCFNEIRPDMEYLESTNVFRFAYDTQIDGESVESWQSILSQIARAADLSEDLPLDEYNVAVSAAILSAMEYCKQNNGDMTVLKSYTEGNTESVAATSVDIDVLFWLGATTEASRNRSYNNEYADFTDPVRNPYRLGQRSIYSLGQVEEDFNISFSKFNHLLVIIGGLMMCIEFFGIILNAIGRIYNMLILYVMAPPFIAMAPFDDGDKFKQWSQAFIVQAFGIFGTVVAIRLMMILIPIIYDSNLVIINTGFFGMLAKTILVFTLAYTAKRATALIGGILSGNGGYASVGASDVAGSMRHGAVGAAAGAAVGTAVGAAKGVGGAALGVAKKGAVLGGGVIGAGLSKAGSAIGAKMSEGKQRLQNYMMKTFSPNSYREKMIRAQGKQNSEMQQRLAQENATNMMMYGGNPSVLASQQGMQQSYGQAAQPQGAMSDGGSSGYGSNAAADGSVQANSESNIAAGSINAVGSPGAGAAKENFDNMNKEDAMKRYRMSDKTYQSTKEKLSNNAAGKKKDNK